MYTDLQDKMSGDDTKLDMISRKQRESKDKGRRCKFTSNHHIIE